MDQDYSRHLRKSVARIRQWRAEGPALFAQEVFGANPTTQQWEASRELVRTRRVSIRSGHGTGKSAFEAWCVPWFLTCYFPAKVPCTAPTSHQLNDVLWSEIAKWHRAMRERLPELANEFEWTSDKFRLKAAPEESFAVARTSRPEQPEALQGFHSENLLFLVDEASGIPEPVFQTAEGALSTPGAFVLMAGNPTRMEGYFHDSHHKMRDKWAALHWNGEDSQLVSPEYIQEMRDKYGADSAIYRIRVLGEFAGNPDGVIPIALLEGAVGRNVQPYGPEVWGVDVARFGEDRTALAKRRGNTLLESIKWWRDKDTMQVAGLIKLEHDQAKNRPTSIFIDVIGLGAGVVDRCRELGLPVVGVNVAESPSVQDRYSRLRDELWFDAREWFERRDVRIPDDQGLMAELSLPSYSVLSNGKIKVEGKDQMKARGVTSPDLADAFCLTFAKGSATNIKRPIAYPKASHRA